MQVQVRLSRAELAKLKTLARNGTYEDALERSIARFRRVTPVVSAYGHDRKQVKIVMAEKLHAEIEQMASWSGISFPAMIRELIY